MKERVYWDNERCAKLRSMWARNATTAELVEAFGIQMHPISARALRMGLGPRKLVMPRDVVRTALGKLGRATLRDLEKDTGLSHNSVDRAIERLKALGEVHAVGTRRVSAGRQHASTVEATVYGLMDDEIEPVSRGDGQPRINRVKHLSGSAPIPPRHPLTAALFGSV